LPHQRSAALAKLQQVASTRLARLLALFDEAFATRLVNRFATVRAMEERIERMMQDQPSDGSVEADLAALREVLDTTVNRRLTDTIVKLGDGLKRVQQIFNEVQQSIGGILSIMSGRMGSRCLVAYPFCHVRKLERDALVGKPRCWS
jgi:serine/threonine-protein kinase